MRELGKKRGVALVSVLILIVLLAAIVVAFLSQARTAATAGNNAAQALVARHLARDAVNDQISALVDEILAGSNLATPPSKVLLPKAGEDYLPKPESGVPVSVGGQTGMINPLLRINRSSKRFVVAQGAAPDSGASAILTSMRAPDGRAVSASVWNLPGLLVGADAVNANLIPAWTYVTRSGRVSSFDPGQIPARNSGSLNENYVLGRYAFRIYDVSGLLDANLAGYPSNVNMDRVRRKGSLAFADLTGAELPGVPANFNLMNWRYPDPYYEQYVDVYGRKEGFFTAPGKFRSTARPGKPAVDYDGSNAQRFFSRRDLSAYLKSPVSGTPEPEVVLSQLTTFTRDRNAPSWKPDSLVANADNSGKTMNPESGFMAVPVKISFMRWDGETAEVGEPLVKYRFPLTKIDRVSEYVSRLNARSGQLATDMRRFFGLEAVNPSDPYVVWNYAPDGTTTTRILTLDEVSAQGREANFFELLKAAVLAESVGQGAKDNSFKNEYLDLDIDRHIFQIGLNIIDQWDEDDFPTVIARTSSLASLNANYAGSDQTVQPDISGVENLPYIYTIGVSSFRRKDVLDSVDGKNGFKNYPNIGVFAQFQLWNPHRNAGGAANYTFRIVAQGQTEILTDQVVASSGNLAEPRRTISGTAQNISDHSIQFATTDAQKFSQPHLLRKSDAVLSHPQDELPGSGLPGFWLGDIVARYNGYRPSQTEPSSGLKSYIEYFSPSVQNAGVDDSRVVVRNPSGGLTFQLQMKVNGTQWIPVQTIPPLTTHRPTGGQGPPSLVNNATKFLVQDVGKVSSSDVFQDPNTPVLNLIYAASDPRTIRFGRTSGQVGVDVNPASPTYKSNDPVVVDAVLPQTGVNLRWIDGWSDNNKGSANGSGSGLGNIGQLATNKESSGGMYYTERGRRVTRLADFGLAGATSGYPTDASLRPVHLNRPFSTVAELGFVFRDLPWKTLNFSLDSENPTATSPPASSDAALMDTFGFSLASLRSGVINLNVASQKSIEALLRGVDLNPGGLSDPLSNTAARSLAVEIFEFLHGSTANPARYPTDARLLRTPADIARMIAVLPTAATLTKAKRETIAAALADAHNARTWNLMIDVIAQSGRFAPQADKLEKFNVGAEQRMIVYVAIDRYTGAIVDRYVEPAFSE